jgi:hypothetical protein
MLKNAKAQVEREWGHGFVKLGARIQQALLAEAVLVLAATQDDQLVSDQIVRRIVQDGWSWVLDQIEGSDV